MVRIKERPTQKQIEYTMSPKYAKNEGHLKIKIRKQSVTSPNIIPQQQGVRKSVRKEAKLQIAPKTELRQQQKMISEAPCAIPKKEEIPQPIIIKGTEDVLMQGNLQSNKILLILTFSKGKYLVKWEETNDHIMLFPEWLPGPVVEKEVPHLVIDFIMSQVDPTLICKSPRARKGR